MVIVGNGAAAAEAAMAARGAGYRGSIDLFADNPHPPYNPMLGTYFASGAIPRQMCFPFGGPEFYERYGVRAHLNTPVALLEPSERRFTTADGAEYTIGPASSPRAPTRPFRPCSVWSRRACAGCARSTMPCD